MSLVGVLLFACFLQNGTLAAEEERAKDVEKRRVVVRVNIHDDDANSYVYVDHGDGEPVLLDSFLAERGYLGITLLELTPELRAHFGAPESAGVMISAIEDDGPAFRSGLAAGDVLITIDGRPVATSAEVMQIVSHGRDRQSVSLEVVRKGRRETLEAALATRERRQLDLGGLIALRARSDEAAATDWHSEGAPRIELDPETMQRALEQMRQHFDSREWQRQVRRFGGSDADLEMRIRELRQRLEELEKELEKLDP